MYTFEIIISAVVFLLCITVYRLIMDDSDADSFQRNVAFDTRIKKLEDEARYIADQPQHTSFYSNSTMSMSFDSLLNAYAMQPNLNEVPINDVVKAIVKHLDMQIEKVSEQTTKTPQEVKVVKKPETTVLNTNGVTGTTWANPCPPPALKPKRKYTKRKAK